MREIRLDCSPVRTFKRTLCLLYFKETLEDICMAFYYFLSAEEAPQCELYSCPLECTLEGTSSCFPPHSGIQVSTAATFFKC